MRKIYSQFTDTTGRPGHAVADITYQSDDSGSGWVSPGRQTLKAAINDGKRYMRSHPDASISVTAEATLTHLLTDTGEIISQTTDSTLVGMILPGGEYVTIDEDIRWL